MVPESGLQPDFDCASYPKTPARPSAAGESAFLTRRVSDAILGEWSPVVTLQLEFTLLDARFALALLPPRSALPAWARGPFVAILQSAEGISTICEESAVPAGVQAQTGLRCLEIAGAFDVESAGVMSAAVQPLAAAGISVFVYSTWQTDYIFFQHSDLERAIAALSEAGHMIHSPRGISEPR